MIKFGTGGFRGIIGEEFTDENLIIIANAIVEYLRINNLKKIIPISYDFRFKSKESAYLIANFLKNKGIRVVLSNKATPTPCVMHYVKLKKLDFGLMITASHNPKEYNGIKFFGYDGLDSNIKITSEIEKIISEGKTAEELEGTLVEEDMLEGYFEFLKNFIDIKVGVKNKILFDFLHGTSLQTIPFFKEYYKLENLDFINDYHDYNFGNMIPNPTYENLIKNRSLQTLKNYEIVLGSDADGDRLALLDENGNYIDNNDILASIYYYLVVYKGLKGDIVKNLTTSNLIDKLALKLGFNSHTVDVGFKNISHKMVEVDALIGGEASGGLTIRNYIMGKDSTLSALIIIEMISKMKMPISKIIEKVRNFTNFHNVYYNKEIHYKNKDVTIKKIENGLIDFIDHNRIEKYNANYKLFLKNDNWIVFRFSGTEPVLRIVIEMDDEYLARKHMNIIEERLSGV